MDDSKKRKKQKPMFILKFLTFFGLAIKNAPAFTGVSAPISLKYGHSIWTPPLIPGISLTTSEQSATRSPIAFGRRVS